MEDSNDTEVSTEFSEEDSNDTEVSTEFSEEDIENYVIDFESSGFKGEPIKILPCLWDIEERYFDAIHEEYMTYCDIPWGRLCDASQRRYNCFDLALKVFPRKKNTYFNNNMRVIFFLLLDKLKLYEVYKFFTNVFTNAE